MIIEKEPEEENVNNNKYLRKKTLREKNDLEKIHKDITFYITNKSKFNNKVIINLLGNFKSIQNLSEIDIKRDIEYGMLFYLNSKNELAIDKKIGLIIFDEGIEYNIDLKENKNYETISDLIEEFNYGCFFAIGMKRKSNLVK